MSAESWKEYELLEAAYWNFDARRAGHNRFAPQAERDAFKAAVQPLLASHLSDEDREALRWLAAVIDLERPNDEGTERALAVLERLIGGG